MTTDPIRFLSPVYADRFSNKVAHCILHVLICHAPIALGDVQVVCWDAEKAGNLLSRELGTFNELHLLRCKEHPLVGQALA